VRLFLWVSYGYFNAEFVLQARFIRFTLLPRKYVRQRKSSYKLQPAVDSGMQETFYAYQRCDVEVLFTELKRPDGVLDEMGSSGKLWTIIGGTGKFSAS